MNLVENYARLNVIADLKKIKVPIPGLVNKEHIDQIKHIATSYRRCSYKQKDYEGLFYGRFYTHPGCIQKMKGTFRNLILDGSLIEVDITNCFPTLLIQEGRRLGIELRGIKDYVNNRERILDAVAVHHHTTRKEAKEMFVPLMFGRQLKASDNNHESLMSFYKDVNKIKHALKDDIAKWDIYVKIATNKNKPRPDDTALAYHLQTIEAKIMMDVIKYLGEKKFRINALVHDGVYIKNKGVMPDLNEISKMVKEKHGFDLEFKVKSTEATEEDKRFYVELQKHLPDDSDLIDAIDGYEITNRIDPTFFHNVERALTNTGDGVYAEYIKGNPEIVPIVDRVADYVQGKFYSMINNGSHFYVHVDRNAFGEVVSKEEHAVSSLKNTFFWKQTSYNKTKESWLETLMALNKMEMRYGYCYGSNNSSYIDLYRRPEIAERVPEPVARRDFTPFMNVIDNLTGHDEKAKDYLLKLIAFMFQHKSQRPDVITVIYGAEGAGKGLIFQDLIGNRMFGEHDFYKAGNQRQINGQFAGQMLEGKRMIILEEVSHASNHALNNELKENVTQKSMEVNKKHKPQYTTTDRSCYFAFSNSNRPLDLGFRRVFALTPSGSLNHDEIDKMLTFMKDDKNIRALYDFFMDMDIEGWIPSRTIPDTEAKDRLQRMNNPLMDFMEDLMSQEGWKRRLSEKDDKQELKTKVHYVSFRDKLREYSKGKGKYWDIVTNAAARDFVTNKLNLKIESGRNVWYWHSNDEGWKNSSSLKEKDENGKLIEKEKVMECVDLKDYFKNASGNKE